MKEVDVSVVMSEYNTEIGLLKQAIESILNQTFKDFEFLIVDDKSKNDLEEIVKPYQDDRIVIIHNEKNLGLTNSLNKAVKMAKGKYIVRMDTDDMAYPERIEKEYAFIKEHPEYAFVGTRAELWDGESIYGITSKVGEMKKEDFIRDTCFIHPTIIMKKEMVEAVGGYPSVNRCEDYALWTTAYLNDYKGYIMDEITLRYTMGIEAYQKRKLKYRHEAIRYKWNYLKKIHAPKKAYLSVFRIVVSGLLPAKFMFEYQKKKFKK